MSGELFFEVVPQRAQQRLIRVWMEPPDTGKFFRLFDEAKAACRARGVEQQDADVDPFVADQVRRIAQDVVGDPAMGWRSSRLQSLL